MESKNKQNKQNLLESTISRRNILALTAAASAGALLESRTGIAGAVEDAISDGVDRIRPMSDNTEREVAHEEVLPVLFEEVIQKLATAEGQARFGVSPTDEEWIFAREAIENDTGEYGPYGEGTIGFGIKDNEDGATERIYYSQMFSVKELIEAWAVRDKESGEITERGLQFGLPKSISDEQDAVDAIESYLAIPDEAMGRATYDLTWRTIHDARILENYELSGWDDEDINHTVSAFGDYMQYTTRSRNSI